MGNISEFYVKQFEDNIELGAQQVISKLRDRCVVKGGVVGKSKAFGYVDKEDSREKTSRHPDVVYDDPNNTRCTAYLSYHYKALLQDPDDSAKVLADPKSTYVTISLASLHRKMDSKILAAARGTKYTGENGTTESALPATSKVAVSTTGLTLAKLRSTLELFNDADVPEEEAKFFCIAPQQLTNLLSITELTSADYNTLKVLVPGKVVTFMGFNFIMSNLLTKVSTTRFCMAWAQSGMGLAIGKDITGRVDEIERKHYAWSSYVSMFIGATRIQDVKVVEIGAKEA